jgi:hypothetical protein
MRSTLSLLLFLIIIPVLAADSTFEWAKFVRPDSKELAEIGIHTSENEIKVFENYPENNEFIKKITIRPGRIDMANAPASGSTAMSPRFIVSTGPDGVATYYSDAEDYRSVAIPDDRQRRDNSEYIHPLEAHRGIDSLVCIRVDFADAGAAYLWYEEMDEIDEKLPAEVKGESLYSPKEFAFDLFPNPAVNFVKIKCKNNARMDCRITIYDVNGRERMLVHSGLLPVEYETEVSLADLEGGMYLVSVLSNDGWRSARKLIVNR